MTRKFKFAAAIATILLIATGLFLILQFRPTYHHGLVSVALKQVVREPSSADPRDKRVCFFDRLSEPHLSREIAFAESNSRFLPQNLRGKPAEILGHFLKSHRQVLATEFSSESAVKTCGSVACLYEKVDLKAQNYGKHAYLIYLLTGVPVGATNIVPLGWSANGTKLSDWLFDSNEMRGLAAVALATTGRGAKVFPAGPLRGIYRMERGKVFSWSPFACGLAYTTGIIQMLDTCLLVGSDPRDLSASLHRSTLHEIGHQVDYGADISTSDSWTVFSGWTRKDIVNRQLKIATKGWAYDPKKEGFPGDYATSSPAEDFAEAMGFYRFGPQVLIQNAPGKFKYIQENYFSGRDFRADTVAIQTAKILSDRHLARIDETLPDCMKSSDLGLAKINVMTKLDGAIGQCTTEAQRKALETELAELSFDEPTRCAASSGATDSTHLMIQKIISEGEAQTLLSVKQFASRESLFAARDELGRRIDPKQIYVELYGRGVKENDYSKALAGAFLANKELFNGILDLNLDSERDRFLALYPLEQTKKDVEIVLDRFFATNKTELVKQIQSVWSQCVRDHKKFTGTPFGVIVAPAIDQVKTSLMACLNERFRPSTDNTIDSLFAQFAKSLGYTIQSQDTGLKRVLQILGSEVAARWLQAILNGQIDRDRKYLNDYLTRNKPTIQSWIVSREFTKQEFALQMVACTKDLHSFLENGFLQNPKLVVLQSSTIVNAAEVDNCRESIETASEYQTKLEAYRRNVARRLFTLAHQSKPLEFPIDSGMSGFKTVGIEKQECQRQLRVEASRQPIKGPSIPSRVFNAAIDEVCFNGRYAGRLVWTLSDRPILFGGAQYFGIAAFDGSSPKGLEGDYYMRAIKRYLEMRTEERLHPSDLSWLM